MASANAEGALAAYDASLPFNASIDETHSSIRILEIELRASEVLIRMEPETYRTNAAELDEEPERVDAGTGAPPETAP